MSPGITEEAGLSARSAIDALKSTPVILSLVIFNVIYMGLGAWQGVADRERQTEMIKVWATEHKNTAQLLAQCSLPPGYKLQSEETKPFVFPDPPPTDPNAPPPGTDHPVPK